VIQFLLNLCQPITVLIFIISGILCFLLGQWTQGAINLSFALCNYLVFYGFNLFGK
jgi:hypothetical protein